MNIWFYKKRKYVGSPTNHERENQAFQKLANKHAYLKAVITMIHWLNKSIFES